MHQTSDFLHRRAFAINTATLSLAALASKSAMAQPATTEKPKRLAPAELNAFPATNAWSLMGNGALRFPNRSARHALRLRPAEKHREDVRLMQGTS